MAKNKKTDPNPSVSEEIMNDLKSVLGVNPTVTISDLNKALQGAILDRNNRAEPSFNGLSPAQMYNWINAPFEDLKLVKIKTPTDLSCSPVMRYLDLILNHAQEAGGSIKLTSDGALPPSLAKKCSDVFSELPVSAANSCNYERQFTSDHGADFHGLLYTETLAQISKLSITTDTHLHFNQEVLNAYQANGVSAFYLAMLRSAIYNFNWANFDHFNKDVDVQKPWLYMIWRISKHGQIDKLIKEVKTAFPHVLPQFKKDQYFSQQQHFANSITIRFLQYFMHMWGFVVLEFDPSDDEDDSPKSVKSQPLLRETFLFDI